MIKFINSWAQGIILAVIIATIIEIILPEGNNKKYIKTILGIYILFIILYPIITKISNKNININTILSEATKEMSNYEINSDITLTTDSYIEDTYKNKIEESITKDLLEQGYKINSIDISIESQKENYGKINSAKLQIQRIKEKDNYIGENNINPINKIEIDVNNIKEKDIKQNIEEFGKEEVKKLKEYLNITYGVEEKNIYINSKEALYD